MREKKEILHVAIQGKCTERRMYVILDKLLHSAPTSQWRAYRLDRNAQGARFKKIGV